MFKLGRRLNVRGLDVRVYPYPTRWALSVYRKKVRENDALGLLYFSENDGSEVIISHSNGSLVTQDAMRLGLRAKGWISFGGAATSDGVSYQDYNFDWAISVYNPHDWALKVGAILPYHGFGHLGLEGYRGNPDGSYDRRWRNVNGASSKRFAINHSHYTGREIDLWEEFSYNNAIEGHSQLKVIRPS